MQNLKTEPLRLITISISHYCEKARWALDRLEVAYIEESHAPLFHRIATRSRGGKNAVPVLVTPAGTLSDSTDILHYLDGLAQNNKQLYPTEPALRQQVEQLEELFDTQLGPATRQWAYSCLPDDRTLLLKLWRQGAPPVEQALLPIVFPLLRQLLRQRYRISATSGVAAYKDIQRVFETVNGLLAGCPYLVGDCFSAADLTFAALAAPALRPENYGVKALQSHELPQDMLAQVKQLRQTPAGAHAMRLYREERHRPS